MEIVTSDPTRPKVDHAQILQKMQQTFIDEGRMKPVALHRVEEWIDFEIELATDVGRQMLTRNWEDKFPGVPFSQETLEAKLAEALSEWKEEALATFLRKAKHDARVTEVRNFINGKSFFFRRWSARLWLGVGLSIPLCIFWATQFFAQSDWQLQLGFWGFVANLLGLGFLTWKTYQSE